MVGIGIIVNFFSFQMYILHRPRIKLLIVSYYYKKKYADIKNKCLSAHRINLQNKTHNKKYKIKIKYMYSNQAKLIYSKDTVPKKLRN